MDEGRAALNTGFLDALANAADEMREQHRRALLDKPVFHLPRWLVEAAAHKAGMTSDDYLRMFGHGDSCEIVVHGDEQEDAP